MCSKFLSVETMRRIRLKSRALFLFISCIFVTSILLVTTNNQRPTIHTLVTETQKQLINLKKNFKDEKKMKVDKVYLHFLGLSDENDSNKNDLDKGIRATEIAAAARTAVPWSMLSNITEPVIVSAVPIGATDQAVGFLKNIFAFRPGSTVILFDLGLGDSDLEQLLHYCNGSMSESQIRIRPNATVAVSRHFQTTSTIESLRKRRKRSVIVDLSGERAKGWCYVAPFDPLDLFPSFVRSKAYRPLAIQQVHRFAGCCIIWLELDQRLTTGNLQNLLNTTRTNGGIGTWLRENTMPTTSLTHPKMFEYLVTSSKVEDYNFQHMIALNAIILFATPTVKRELMLPWVQCALLSDCIEPIGAQSSGCRFDKKPQFRYSGCHSYDVSALNIILGQMFSFDESKYISDFKFFGKALEEDEDDEEDVDEREDKNETLQQTSGQNKFSD